MDGMRKQYGRGSYGDEGLERGGNGGWNGKGGPQGPGTARRMSLGGEDGSRDGSVRAGGNHGGYRGSMGDDGGAGTSREGGGPGSLRTLAEWRDEMLLAGGIPKETAFAAALALARRMDALGKNAAALSGLCPEAVAIEADSDWRRAPAVTGFDRNADGADSEPYRMADGSGNARKAARHALACILHELLTGMRPSPAYRRIPGLSASQNRAFGKVYGGGGGGSYASLVGNVHAGRDGRGWIPVAAAVGILAAAAGGWHFWKGIRAHRAEELERLRETAEKSTGMWSSTVSIASSRLIG